MVTSLQNEKRHQFIGLSTDTKPVEEENGAVFIEMDTSKVFLFNKDAADGIDAWIEFTGNCVFALR